MAYIMQALCLKENVYIMEEYLNYSGFSGRFGGWHGVDNFHGTESQAFWWSTSPVDNSFYSPRVTNSGLSLNTNVISCISVSIILLLIGIRPLNDASKDIFVFV